MCEVDFSPKEKMKLKEWPIMFEEINALYQDASKIFFESKFKTNNHDFEDNYLNNIFRNNQIFDEVRSFTPSKISKFN